MRLAAINKQCQALNWILSHVVKMSRITVFSFIMIAVLRHVVVAMIIRVGVSWIQCLNKSFRAAMLQG